MSERFTICRRALIDFVIFGLALIFNQHDLEDAFLGSRMSGLASIVLIARIIVTHRNSDHLGNGFSFF